MFLVILSIEEVLIHFPSHHFVFIFSVFQLFTVVRNVKEAHECQEYGEKQEFQDDVDYMLDGLQCSQPLATRCLRYNPHVYTWFLNHLRLFQASTALFLVNHSQVSLMGMATFSVFFQKCRKIGHSVKCSVWTLLTLLFLIFILGYNFRFHSISHIDKSLSSH